MFPGSAPFSGGNPTLSRKPVSRSLGALISPLSIGYKRPPSLARATARATPRARHDHEPSASTPAPRAWPNCLQRRAFRHDRRGHAAGFLRCDDLMQKALPLRGLADAVNVTDGAGARAHMSAPSPPRMLVAGRHRADPAVHLPRPQPHRAAERADGRGRARHPQPADSHRRRPEGRRPARSQGGVRSRFERADRDWRGASRDRRAAAGPQGAARRTFFIGAADAPIDPPPDWQPTKLAAKVAAGAQFAQTQFCMDVGVVRRYLRSGSPNTGSRAISLMLIGIAPLRSAKSARLDEAAPLRHHHRRRIIARHGKGGRSGGRRGSASASS